MDATRGAPALTGQVTGSESNRREDRGFLIFCVVALGLGWAIWLPAALAYHGVIAVTIPMLDGLVAWLPGIGALIAVGYARGWSGVRELLGRFGRIEPRWLFGTVALVVSLGVACLGLSLLLGFPPLSVNLAIVPITFLALIPWNLGEEIGWRGYLVPRLVPGSGLIRAGLISGLIWATWHLPFWSKSPVFADPVLIGAAWVGGIAFGLILAWLVVGARYSLLVATIGHVTFNTTITALGILPQAGGARGPWLVFTVLLVVCALAISLYHTRSSQRIPVS